MVIRGFFSSRLKASSVQGSMEALSVRSSIEASLVQGLRLRVILDF